MNRPQWASTASLALSLTADTLITICVLFYLLQRRQRGIKQSALHQLSVRPTHSRLQNRNHHSQAHPPYCCYRRCYRVRETCSILTSHNFLQASDCDLAHPGRSLSEDILQHNLLFPFEQMLHQLDACVVRLIHSQFFP